ncbi:UNVERIFIED_CONTAM: hypothetical protein K2H54_055659 [Gekko kuhli]
MELDTHRPEDSDDDLLSPEEPEENTPTRNTQLEINGQPAKAIGGTPAPDATNGLDNILVPPPTPRLAAGPAFDTVPEPAAPSVEPCCSNHEWHRPAYLKDFVS